MNARLRLTVALVVLAAAVAAGILVTQGGASHSQATLSNHGGAAVTIRGLRMRGATIHNGSVVAVRKGRAFYRLNVVGGGTCFGVGRASDIGNPGSVTCPAGGFPRTGGDLVLDLSVYEGTRHDLREFSLYRVEGFAADGVAAVEFFRPNGEVALRVPVSGNVYSASTVPRGPIAGLAALDKDGKRVWRSP
jgi:hypothetical protein